MSIALVTGASKGIGAATAVRLAQDGHDVAIAYGGSADAAEEVAARVRAAGRRAETLQADLGDPQAASALVGRVEEQLGTVDVLVASAGVNAPTAQDARDITVEEWDRFMAINLRAPFLVAQAALGGMLERSFGRIVLLSSVAAYTGGIIGAHYAASKAGLHGVAHSLSQQASGKGVTVNVVAPALIATDMLPSDDDSRKALAGKVPVGRLGQADEVADFIAAVVRNGYITNQSMLIDGGMQAS